MREDIYRTPVSDPEAEGLPQYADDDSTAYDDTASHRVADGPDPASLPGDQPLAVDRFGTTTEEARLGESLDYKLRREFGARPQERTENPYPRTGDEGEPLTDDTDRVPTSTLDVPEPPVDPYDKVSMYDRVDVDDPDRPIGRLVEPDEGVRPDEEPDAVAYDAGPAGGGRTAEEAAMHEIRDP